MRSIEGASYILREICAFDKNQGVHHDLPYVGLEHIESNTGRFIGSLNATKVKSNTFCFTKESVLYGRLRPYLNKVLCPEFNGHCSTEIFPIVPNHLLERRYLFYWFLLDETANKVNETCTGARMPRANMNEVMEFDVFVPSRTEQKRIVSILDEAFEGIATAKANTEQSLKNIGAMFEGRLDEIFRQRGESWRECPLSELCSIKHGFAFKSEFFANSGEYILLTPGNFYESGGFRDRGEKQKYYIGEIPSDFIVNKGDLLVAMTEQAAGLLGSPILVPESGKFLHNQRLGLVSPNIGIPWLNDFFFYVFNTQHVRKSIHYSASGVKVRHTSPTKIGDVLVAFPDSIEQQKVIVDSLGELQEELKRLEAIKFKKIAALDELKKSLLHKAFSGEL